MSDTDKTRAAMLARIRALMARTVANGCTEAEAKEAAAKVDELMGSYEIDLTETVLQEQEVVRVDIKLNHHPVRTAALRIATFCDCRAWADKGFISYLGIDVDTSVAEYLTLLFQRSIDREVDNYAMFNPEMALEGPSGQANMTHSFSIGMATRLGERLTELKSKRDFRKRSTGFDLVKAKKPIVDEAFASLGLVLERGGGSTSIRHEGAFVAGRNAAEGVSISPGVAGGGAKPSGRIR